MRRASSSSAGDLGQSFILLLQFPYLLLLLPVRLLKHYRVQIVYDQVCSVCVSLRSKRFRGVSAQISMFDRAKIKARANKRKRGEEREEKCSPPPYSFFWSCLNSCAAKTSKFARKPQKKRLLRVYYVCIYCYNYIIFVPVL